MTLTFTILGCGSSGGVPRVGQGWGACDPGDRRNRRRRCSMLLTREGESGGMTRVLVDVSPDLREQALDAEIDHLDAILMTHGHADHCHGIDDVRPLVQRSRRRIGIHMDDATADRVRHGFDYLFATPPGSHYPPLLDDRRISPGEAITIEGDGGPIGAVPMRLRHGEIDALGYRFDGPAGSLAYTPDVNDIPEASAAMLRDLDVWIVDALRYTPHPSHFCLEETLDWISRLSPRRAFLTNLHTDMDYAQLAARLPDGIEPAFDGMRVGF